MMGQANYWLLGLAFVLGLVLTFALTIRRVEREVPVRSSTGVAPAAVAEAESPTTKLPVAAATTAPAKSPSEAETTKMKTTSAESPYGAGSALPGADGSGPAGWLVKGNEDSMLYHTPDSPHYKQTIAEVWFKDEQSAAQGGFTSWREGRKKK
jgi:uncharacterized membrane protein ArfC